MSNFEMSKMHEIGFEVKRTDSAFLIDIHLASRPFTNADNRPRTSHLYRYKLQRGTADPRLEQVLLEIQPDGSEKLLEEGITVMLRQAPEDVQLFVKTAHGKAASLFKRDESADTYREDYLKTTVEDSKASKAFAG